MTRGERGFTWLCSPPGVLAVTASAWLAACSDAVVWLEPPPLQDEATLLLALVSPDRTQLRAFRLEPRPEVISFDAPPEVLRLEALLYAEPLDTLGLEAGTVPLLSGGEGAFVPVPDRSFRAELTGRMASAWSSEPPSEAVATLRIPAAMPTGCREPMTATFALPGAEQPVSFIVALDDTTALIGAETRLYVFDGDEPREITPLPAGLPLRAAAIDPDGTLWFGGDRELWRGRYEGGVLSAEPIAEKAPSASALLQWLATAGPALFVLSREGELFRFDRATRVWTSLHQFPPSEYDEGGVVALGPDQAAAVLGSENTIVRVRTTSVTTETLALDSVGMSGLGLIPGLGLFIGTTSGTVVFQREGQWMIRTDTRFGGRVRQVLPFGRGAILAGGSGVTSEYDAVRNTFCPANPRAASSVYDGAALGSSVLLGGSRSGDRTAITLIRP